MARLTEVQKTFVVERLACFRTPTEVVGLVKEIFGVAVSRQQVQVYDPTVPSTRTPKKWGALFEATRKAYLKAKAEVGIASERWRMERRQVLYERAESMGKHGNIPLCLQILEQAEKAEGGAYTNRHKVNHSGQVNTTGVLVLPSTPDNWSEQAREQQKELEEAAARAVEAAVGG